MRLTADEEAMLDGKEGRAVQRAMELLVQYGDALGAERLVDTNNVCGANVFLLHLGYQSSKAMIKSSRK